LKQTELILKTQIMKRLLSVIVAILMMSTFSQAQIKVASNNYVGIYGVSTPLSKLAVGNSGNSDCFAYFENQTITGSPYAFRAYQLAATTGTGITASAGQVILGIGTASQGKNIGFFSQAYASSPQSVGSSFGIYTSAGNATSGYNYGVFSFITGSNYGAAIWGGIPNKNQPQPVPGQYAGYFRGQVFIEDSLHVNLEISSPHFYVWSDERLKRNISALATGNVNKIKQLNAVTYNLISTEDYRLSKMTIVNDTANVSASNANLDAKVDNSTRNIGFLAQDLQKVFPQLVHSDKDGVLAVDYTGLIPVLVEALKEQQLTIDGLKSDMLLLKQKLNISTTTPTQTIDTSTIQ
jgi:hypothetical protein